MFWQRVNYTQNDMQFTVYLTIYCVRMKEYFIHDPNALDKKKKKKKINRILQASWEYIFSGMIYSSIDVLFLVLIQPNFCEHDPMLVEFCTTCCFCFMVDYILKRY